MAVSVEGHRERMRHRAEQMDKEDIRSQDLVELLLYYALPRRDTKEQAAALMERYGSLEAIMAADVSDIAQTPGIGRATAEWLGNVGELLDTYKKLESGDRPLINNQLRTERYLAKFFKDFDYPEVWQFCISAGGWLLGADRISDSAAWGEPEYLRQALGTAMALRAHSVIIAQFTVTPMAELDEYDVERTFGYSTTLYAADIQLLDHMFICPDGIRSMYAEGKLERIQQMVKTNHLRENYLLPAMENDE